MAAFLTSLELSKRRILLSRFWRAAAAASGLNAQAVRRRLCRSASTFDPKGTVDIRDRLEEGGGRLPKGEYGFLRGLLAENLEAHSRRYSMKTCSCL